MYSTLLTLTKKQTAADTKNIFWHAATVWCEVKEDWTCKYYNVQFVSPTKLGSARVPCGLHCILLLAVHNVEKGHRGHGKVMGVKEDMLVLTAYYFYIGKMKCILLFVFNLFLYLFFMYIIVNSWNLCNGP